ncbi:MAG TPA: META domain-containing protein [Anaerolineae bacterium]|nr:META domain-containing protein [Ardenticatenia bacterium]MBK8539452.1 META domain-containing protein [Ardenticatenia bacterium]HQZ70935.1 META domain-containing protein [Anaerolineae bacterium]HRA19287.1 META domain-containing protein [Anaerolineae bacterium]
MPTVPRLRAMIHLAMVAMAAMACTEGSSLPSGKPVAATALVEASPPPAATDGPTGPTLVADSIPAGLSGRVWQLDSFDEGSTITDSSDGWEPTLTFVGGRVAGNSGCNSFSGPVIFGATTSDGQALHLPQTAVTQMACLDPLLNEQEARFLDYLGRVTHFRLSVADVLVLEDEAGQIGLRFIAAPLRP